MTTPPEPLKLAAVLVRNERASDTVAALCNTLPWARHQTKEV